MGIENDLRCDAQILIAMRYGWVSRDRMTEIDGDRLFAWMAQLPMPSAKRRRYRRLLRRPLAAGGLRAVVISGVTGTADGRRRDVAVAATENGDPFAGAQTRLVIESGSLDAAPDETAHRSYRLCDGRDWSAPALWLVRDAADCPADSAKAADLAAAPRRVTAAAVR